MASVSVVMTTSPIIPAHPLDHSNVVKIMLSRAASDALRGIGEYHLAIVTRPDSTMPQEAQDRLILVCAPLSKDRAHNASRVALGSHRAARLKTSTTPASSPITSSSSSP